MEGAPFMPDYSGGSRTVGIEAQVGWPPGKHAISTRRPQEIAHPQWSHTQVVTPQMEALFNVLVSHRQTSIQTLAA